MERGEKMTSGYFTPKATLWKKIIGNILFCISFFFSPCWFCPHLVAIIRRSLLSGFLSTCDLSPWLLWWFVCIILARWVERSRVLHQFQFSIKSYKWLFSSKLASSFESSWFWPKSLDTVSMIYFLEIFRVFIYYSRLIGFHWKSVQEVSDQRKLYAEKRNKNETHYSLTRK